jgi:hypothetical protein
MIGRIPLMTIRAQDLTFRNLQLDAGGREAKVDHVANVGHLCSGVKMIELQDDGVAHPTHNAGMLTQKLDDEDTIRLALVRVVPLISVQIRALVVQAVPPRNEPTACAAT